MKSFNEGLEGLLEAIKMDYYRWYLRTEYCKGEEDAMDEAEKMKDQMSFEEGRKYIKVLRTDNQQSVWGFIMKDDDNKFKKGDILMAAGFNAPARNKPRGNILEEYFINWTGPRYL